MAGEKFKLNFVTNGEGIVEIDEPIGFDAADFNLKQKQKGLARSVSFSGGESEFTFYIERNHYFDTLIYYLQTFGWESEVKLIIEIDGVDNIIGDLDFFEAETDLLEYFKCKVIQDSNEAALERRKDINVDVFSDKNIDGDTITSLSPKNLLLKAKPITQNANWETPETFSAKLFAGGPGLSRTEYYYINPAINLKSYDIDDSLTFISQLERDGNNFQIIEAVNNLRNLKIEINNLNLSVVNTVDSGGDGYSNFRLFIKYGTDFNTATDVVFFDDTTNDGNTYTNTNNYSLEIPYLARGEKIWLYFLVKVRQSKDVTIGGNPIFTADTTISSMDVSATASSIAYNTIVPSIPLKEGVSQVVKSISGLSTNFPIAEVNGELYNNRIFNGNLLRNLTDKPFNISLKDIEEWLPEIYGDYEVQSDGSVFFGVYKDFYVNKEIGVFTDVTFDDYKKSFNDRYAINEFGYKYKKYQSQKETEVENTFDVVHGETQWSVLNKLVENKKEVAVSFVRDSFYIDEQRRKAFDLNNNTATQDDETKFILDCKEALTDSYFTETDFLQHTYDETTGYLKIKNTGNFSFTLLGLAVGEDFEIIEDANQGTYKIVELADRYIVLNNGSGNTANNGERSTQFKYLVSTTTAPYISWSSEDFALISGLVDSDNFSNLKYTVKRNIINFYNQYLATCNLFANKEIKSTLYQNNGDLALSFGGVQTVEKEAFTPTNPILSPYKHQITLVTDFKTYKNLEKNIKQERGYIRTFDAEGLVIKVYPQEMKFVNQGELGQLSIVGEEKYQKSLINIISGGIGYVSINNEYRTPKISYDVSGERIYIKDEQGLLLYNPVFWQKISFNGATPESKEQLIEWLTSIS